MTDPQYSTGQYAPGQGAASPQYPAGQPPAYGAGAHGPVGKPENPVTQILLTIVTLGIWSLVWTYRQYRDTKNYSGQGVGGGIGLLLQIVIGIVTPFLLCHEIENNLYRRQGQESPVSAVTGLWVLIPLVGSLIWYFKTQRALNDFWVSQGATAP